MAILLKGYLAKGLFFHQNLRIVSSKIRNNSSINTQNDQKKDEPDDSSWFNHETEENIDDRVVPKPVSVMPDHLPQTRRRQVQKPWWKFRYFIEMDTLPRDEVVYTEKPEYPAIFDSTQKGITKEIRKEWYKAIRRLPTADQKIYEITKHYGHLQYMLDQTFRQYNMLPIQQSITKTRLINGLPQKYSQNQESINPALKEAIIKTIKSRLFSMKTIANKINFKNSSLPLLGFPNEENKISSNAEEDIIYDVVRLVKNFSGSDSDIQIDYNPFIATSWWIDDYPIPFKKSKWFQDRERYDQCFVYKSTHALQVRSPMPLPEVVNFQDNLSNNLASKEDALPKYNLLSLGVPLCRHNIISLPGFWPGCSDGFDYPVLIGLSRQVLRARIEKNKRDFNDSDDILDGMAIMSAFSTLTSAANNLGFSLYDSLTYPLVTHVICTDGQNWSFHVYQLNKHNFHSDLNQSGDKNDLCNICWSSGNLKLFESYENGQLVGINDKVLSLMVKFIDATILHETAIELRPYLGEDTRTELEKEELNYSLRRKFSNQIDHFISSRKKTNLWEKVYKLHNKAPYDPKRIRPKLFYKYPPFFK